MLIKTGKRAHRPSVAVDDRRTPSTLRRGLVAGIAAAATAVALLFTTTAAARPLSDPQPPAAATTASSSSMFDDAAAGTTSDDVSGAAEQRAAAMQAENDAVAAAQQDAALQERQDSMQVASTAIQQEAAKLAAATSFTWPTSGTITSPFGMRLHPILHIYRLHDGIDITTACGTPVYATQAGIVTKTETGYSGGSGNNVEIDHGTANGKDIRSGYLHLTSFIVTVGQKVIKGQLIGYVGSTGLSTGCHLHLHVEANGTGVDPLGGFLKGSVGDRVTALS